MLTKRYTAASRRFLGRLSSKAPYPRPLPTAFWLSRERQKNVASVRPRLPLGRRLSLRNQHDGSRRRCCDVEPRRANRPKLAWGEAEDKSGEEGPGQSKIAWRNSCTMLRRRLACVIAMTPWSVWYVGSSLLSGVWDAALSEGPLVFLGVQRVGQDFSSSVWPSVLFLLLGPLMLGFPSLLSPGVVDSYYALQRSHLRSVWEFFDCSRQFFPSRAYLCHRQRSLRAWNLHDDKFVSSSIYLQFGLFGVRLAVGRPVDCHYKLMRIWDRAEHAEETINHWTFIRGNQHRNLYRLFITHSFVSIIHWRVPVKIRWWSWWTTSILFHMCQSVYSVLFYCRLKVDCNAIRCRWYML